MTTYTRDVITETLEKLVAEKGADYVYDYPMQSYKACYYAHPGTGAPSCVVGHLVNALDPEAFKELAEEEVTNGGFDVLMLTSNFHFLDIEGDRDLIQALQAFQTSQDLGEPWGEGLAKYHARLEGAY